jgi:hypothetical protein
VKVKKLLKFFAISLDPVFEKDFSNLSTKELSKLWTLGQYHDVKAVEKHIVSYLGDQVKGLNSRIEVNEDIGKLQMPLDT